jgi:4-hydroxy-3-methylbut-2-enyl diphosphate reductase
MRVVRSEVLGMCFGVRDALKAMDRLEAPEAVTIHGELVHNEVVLAGLAARGFKTVSEADRGRCPRPPTC